MHCTYNYFQKVSPIVKNEVNSTGLVFKKFIITDFVNIEFCNEYELHASCIEDFPFFARSIQFGAIRIGELNGEHDALVVGPNE